MFYVVLIHALIFIIMNYNELYPAHAYAQMTLIDLRWLEELDDLLHCAFQKMSDFERLSSACRLIVYAGADAIVARSDCLLARYESVQNIKNGMYYYAMAMET